MQKYLYLFSDRMGQLRHKVTGLYTLLILFQLVVWLWAFYALHQHSLLFSTAILAYTFGLRHAVDADHIAAIDNVTRKLMQEGKQPVAAGLFFSLGHSTVVILATICVAMAASSFMHNYLTQWHAIGNIIFTAVSSVFLLLIALINLIIFIGIWKLLQRARAGANNINHDIDFMLTSQGFLVQRFRRLFRLINHSWQMYFLGFLFALGFDTATEIILLGITTTEAKHGLSFTTILIFPALFTAGMTLIDTTDNLVMLGAYGWAFMKPIRKLYYNLTITFISVTVALSLGIIEVLGLIADHLDSSAYIWSFIKSLNSNLDSLGYVIIGIFILCWMISLLFYKLRQVNR